MSQVATAAPKRGAAQSKPQNSLFPVHASLAAAEEFAYSRLPVSSQNEMYGILMTYQNTLRATASFDSRS